MYILYVKTIILGIIEAISEFFPVSSTAHLELAHYLLAFHVQHTGSFIIFIQLGPILAAFIVYFSTFKNLIPPLSPTKWKAYFFDQPISPMHFILAVLPISIVGLLFYKIEKTYLSSTLILASGLFIGSVFLFFADRYQKRSLAKGKVAQAGVVSYKQAFLIGLGQCLALFPGMSRSGSTIGSAFFVDVEQQTAANFSFIIAVPTTLAATMLDLIKTPISLNDSSLTLFALGFIVSFITAFFSIRLFLYILKKLGFTPFIYYRVLLSLAIFSVYFLKR